MPFTFGVDGAPATPYATHATPNTEDPTVVIRGGTVGFWLAALGCFGRAAAATSITGIGYRQRRWTTAGSGGTAVTPNPRQNAPAANTTAADKVSAITAGTVSGVYQALALGCGVGGPGGWMARDQDAMVRIEGGSSDELDINSVCGVASQLHHLTAEIQE